MAPVEFPPGEAPVTSEAAEKVQDRSRAKDRPPAAKKTGRGGSRAGAGRPRGSTNKTAAPTDKVLIDGLGQILSIPAMPAAMVGELWVANHFTNAGPQFAAQLVAASKTNVRLRTILEQAVAGESYAVLLIAAFGYAVPPILYFATGDHHPARTVLKVPPRQARGSVPGGGFDPGSAAPGGGEPSRATSPPGASRVPPPPNGDGPIASSQPG